MRAYKVGARVKSAASVIKIGDFKLGLARLTYQPLQPSRQGGGNDLLSCP